MISRRGLLGVFGLAGATAAAPITMATKVFDPGRRVTHLPNGGLLVEGQQFDDALTIQNCSYLTLSQCSINLPKRESEIKLLDV